MRKLLTLTAACCLAAGSACAEPDPLFSEIDGILAELAKITGLAPRRPVEYARIGKSQVREFLAQQVKEAITPEEIRAEELALKKFGLVPADFDLEKTTLDLLSEQAAAFYDYRKKKLFVIDSGGSILQNMALVHELAHALADQHFNLRAFIDGAGKSDDGALARQATMEGQATWLMSEYVARRSGQSLKDSPMLVKLMSSSTEIPEGQFPVFDRAPLYLRETLLFPYAKGLLFQQEVVKRHDKAGFTEVFRHPPVSTQQILHPEIYFAGTKPADAPLPALEKAHEWRTVIAGGFGELDHAILLKQLAGGKDAAPLTVEWRGGAYRLAEAKSGGRVVLQYASRWSSEQTAERFFGLYQKALRAKWKSYEPATASADVIFGRGDDGYFVLRRQGTLVTSLEGLAAPALH